MLSDPPFYSFKRACQVDLGGALQLIRKTLWCGENCGCSIEVFLLDKTMTGHWKIY